MKLLEQEYKLIKNNKECFNLEEVEEKITDYFKDYDYIVGDYAYSKLRLKGFTKKFNKLNRDINDFENVDKYIKENCAYGCKYFILEKIN
ncbi:putative uncharacterized protein [Clostridium sp. CAG:628]|jgi:uncharacterized protein YutD|nr:putative uncharacterized protein [Clostridium sp. CAG:628]